MVEAMEHEILYKSEKTDGGLKVYLDYYIIPESICADYCDLMRYGVKIEKTTCFEGGGKIIESQQINNVFYRRRDADEFLSHAAQTRTEPRILREFTENYITQSLDRARQSA